MSANRVVPLLRKEPLADAYFLLTFRHAEVAHEARAGQFVMIKAGTSAEPPLRRPFSVMEREPAEDTFTLFVKAIGPGTRALAALEPGDLAQCLGPLGRPFPAPARGTEALLVAGGYGIAPFHLFTEELREADLRSRVFYGGKSARDLQVRGGFTERGATLVAATEDGSLGHRGLVTAPLEAYLEAAPGPVKLYACGPDAMLHAMARIAARRGIEAAVSLDPWMGCGIGTCLGCVIKVQGPAEPRPKNRCACTEGPVFDAATVVWAGEKESEARRRRPEGTA